MWNAVEERTYNTGDIADKFIRSDYNNVCFDGSDLPLQVNEFLRAHNKDRKYHLSEQQREFLMETLLDTFQRQIRYRFDD